MIAIAKYPPGAPGDPGPETSEPRDLAVMVSEIERLEQLFRGWPDVQRGQVMAYKRAIDTLHGEAVRRLVRACKAEPAALATLRAAVTDEVVYCVLRQLQIVKPSLPERVEHALAAVRPQLASHGGDVVLVRIAPPVVFVRLTGACDGCASSATTLYAGVKQAVLDACPELTDVVQADARTAAAGVAAPVSPFAATALGVWRYVCELGELIDGGVRAFAIGDHRILVARRAASSTTSPPGRA